MIFNEFRKLNDYKTTLIFACKNQKRSYFRKITSLIYTKLINLSFNTEFKYFNGPIFYNGNDLRKMNFQSKSFFQAEILLKLNQRKNFKYKEVEVNLIKPQFYKSNVLKLSLIMNLMKEYFIYLKKFYLK